MPDREKFTSPEQLYSVLWHELGHATGHEKRLARKSLMDTSFFGSHEYAKDELVAEFTSAMLCGHCGIENMTIINSASYIQGWLKALRNDSKLAIIAAGQAQKAADFILGKEREEN
jgi:antirestriction protein ArdC